MKLRHIGILLLIIVSSFGVYDLWGSDVWSGVIVAYIVTYGLAAVVLFFLSTSSKKKDAVGLQKLDNLGVLVSIGSIVISILYFILDTIRFYNQ